MLRSGMFRHRVTSQFVPLGMAAPASTNDGGLDAICRRLNLPLAGSSVVRWALVGIKLSQSAPLMHRRGQRGRPVGSRGKLHRDGDEKVLQAIEAVLKERGRLGRARPNDVPVKAVRALQAAGFLDKAVSLETHQKRLQRQLQRRAADRMALANALMDYSPDK